MSAPLEGLVVVALEQAISAPLCTRHFAELGARVIKVERPVGGDSTRHYDDAVHGMSSHFVWLNRGKESISIDLKSESGRREFERLLDVADVFISNAAPGSLSQLGLDPESIQRQRPRLVVVEITGFGTGGPMSNKRAYDLLIQAESGVCSLTGSPGRPVKPGVPTVDFSTALYAFSSAVTALYARNVNGMGSFISLSMLDVAAEMTGAALNEVLHTGSQPESVPMGASSVVPYGAYQTSDGAHVVLGATSDAEWHRISTELLGAAELAHDPRFATNAARVANRREVDARIEAWSRRHSIAVIQAAADRAKIGNARLNSMHDLVDHPQLSARDRWEDVTVHGSHARVLKAPFIGGSWANAARRMVPALGEDTEQILSELQVMPMREEESMRSEFEPSPSS